MFRFAPLERLRAEERLLQDFGRCLYLDCSSYHVPLTMTAIYQLCSLLSQHAACSSHVVFSGRHHVSFRNGSRHLVSIHDRDLRDDRNSVTLFANNANSFVKFMFSLATIWYFVQRAEHLF